MPLSGVNSGEQIFRFIFAGDVRLAQEGGVDSIVFRY